MTVYRGDGFSYRVTVKTFSGASDSPDSTFSLVSEPDMRPRLRFPTFLALSGPSENSPTKVCGTSERCVSQNIAIRTCAIKTGIFIKLRIEPDRVSWGWIFVPWDREDLFWSLGFTRHYVFPGLGARYAPETTFFKVFWPLRPA